MRASPSFRPGIPPVGDQCAEFQVKVRSFAQPGTVRTASRLPRSVPRFGDRIRCAGSQPRCPPPSGALLPQNTVGANDPGARSPASSAARGKFRWQNPSGQRDADWSDRDGRAPVCFKSFGLKVLRITRSVDATTGKIPVVAANISADI